MPEIGLSLQLVEIQSHQFPAELGGHQRSEGRIGDDRDEQLGVNAKDNPIPRMKGVDRRIQAKKSQHDIVEGFDYKKALPVSEEIYTQ